MRRSVKGEVMASTFDRPSDEHTHVAELTIAKAKPHGRGRQGRRDHARRHHPPGPGLQPGGTATGKIMSGGIDAGALYPPKKFFGVGPQRRGGRLADDPGHRAGRDQQPDGRGDLRGVQGHRQHGAAPRPRSPSGASTRRSTWTPPPPDTRSCSSTASSSSRCGSCAECCRAWPRTAAPPPASSSSSTGMKTFRTNDEFLAEIAKQPSM
jgi:hypothetical protein